MLEKNKVKNRELLSNFDLKSSLFLCSKLFFQRKEKSSEFAKDFDTCNEDFKIGMLIKEIRFEK